MNLHTHISRLASRSGLRKLLLPACILILLAILAYSLLQKQQAPNVTFTTLQGEIVQMNDLRGKMVLVNFWATTCTGCIAEMPKLIETYKQYHNQGFEIVAVAMSYDPPSHVLNYAEKKALPFPVSLDIQGDIASRFDNVQLTPTTFVIDQQGRIVRHVVGIIDFTALHSLLDKQLARPS